MSTVACIGDSNVEGYPFGWMNQAWPYYLGQKLGATTWNEGVGGERADEVLARFQTDVLDHNPDYCGIGVGGNDCLQSRSQALVEADYEEMAETCLAEGITPFFTLIQPLGGWDGGWNGTKEAERVALNAWLEASPYASVNFEPWIADGSDPARLHGEYDYGDGAHLTDLAKRRMAHQIWQTVFRRETTTGRVLIPVAA